MQIYGIVKKKCVLGLWLFWLGRKGGESKMEDKKCEIFMTFFIFLFFLFFIMCVVKIRENGQGVGGVFHLGPSKIIILRIFTLVVLEN